MKEQRLAGKKPENSKELFNLRHASLRNVVERIFGVLKRKYQILRTPSEYSVYTQTRIILACTCLYNWVRTEEGIMADKFLEIRRDTSTITGDIQPVVIYSVGSNTSKRMDTFRDELAERMWLDYKRYLESGGTTDLTGE